eukprot:gene9328-16459_t
MIDDVSLISELFGQMSEGWGEGVSQRLFGPRIDISGPNPTDLGGEYKESRRDILNDIVGRFAFTLSPYGMCLNAT